MAIPTLRRADAPDAPPSTGEELNGTDPGRRPDRASEPGLRQGVVEIGEQAVHAR